MNPRVQKIQYESPHLLILTFTNAETKVFDLTAYLHYPVYEALQDETFCKKAKVVLGTAAWDDEIDFDPDTLYLESKPLTITQ